MCLSVSDNNAYKIRHQYYLNSLFYLFSLSLPLFLFPPFHPVIMQALHVNPSDCYNIHWPVIRGQLNVHSGPGGSLTAVLADLETIWSHVIQKQLEIPLKDLKVGETSSHLHITKCSMLNV